MMSCECVCFTNDMLLAFQLQRVGIDGHSHFHVDGDTISEKAFRELHVRCWGTSNGYCGGTCS